VLAFNTPIFVPDWDELPYAPSAAVLPYTAYPFAAPPFQSTETDFSVPPLVAVQIPALFPVFIWMVDVVLLLAVSPSYTAGDPPGACTPLNDLP
jgi:hypothetical protein